MHDRAMIVLAELGPRVVLEADAGRQPGVLVAQAEDVPELVAQDARR